MITLFQILPYLQGFIAALLPLLDPQSRAGGGSSFHGSNSGSSSGGGSSGGGDGGEALFRLLIWLVFEVPEIGIPLLIIVAIIWFYTQTGGAQKSVQQVFRGPSTSPARGQIQASQNLLRQQDPTFSEPLFMDLARLIYTRAQQCRGGDFAPVQAYLGNGVSQTLDAKKVKVQAVIIGSSRITQVQLQGENAFIRVRFESNLTEIQVKGLQEMYRVETWTFRRNIRQKSPGPEKMRTLACTNCGSPLETTPEGRCRSCDTLANDGRIQWCAIAIEVAEERPLPALKPETGGGLEQGTDLPTLTAPDLAAATRALRARHPELHWEDFRKHATEVFTKIQIAWSSGEWEQARPYETDFLYTQHRYWMERYKKEGLKNRMKDLVVTNVVPAKITVDAYLESITVRIYARMKDWTENAAGKVVGGSSTQDRIFSEYWTFVRTAGQPAKPREHVENCPACGAALDRVSESGVCGYCEAKITGGDHDWVLSGIDQDEVYRG